MTAMSRLFCTFGATLLATTVCASTLAAQYPTCTCKDIPSLLKLLSRGNAADSSLVQLAAAVSPTQLTTDMTTATKPPTTYLDWADKQVMDAVKAASNDRVPYTACGSIQGYYKNKETNLRYYLRSWDEHVRLENDRILSILNAMPSSCRLGDWFGSISVAETLNDSGEQHIPPKNDYEARWDKGSDESFKRTVTRSGTIWLSGTADLPVSNWQAGESITKNTVHHQLVSCEEGKPATIGRTSTTNEEITQSGSGYRVGEVDLSINEERDTVFVSLSLPEIEISGPYDKTDSIAGGCPKDKPPKDEHMSMKDSMSKAQVDAKAQITPGSPLRASGTQTFTLPSPSPKGSHMISVTFHLYKLR